MKKIVKIVTLSFVLLFVFGAVAYADTKYNVVATTKPGEWYKGRTDGGVYKINIPDKRYMEITLNKNSGVTIEGTACIGTYDNRKYYYGDQLHNGGTKTLTWYVILPKGTYYIRASYYNYDASGSAEKCFKYKYIKYSAITNYRKVNATIVPSKKDTIFIDIFDNWDRHWYKIKIPKNQKITFYGIQPDRLIPEFDGVSAYSGFNVYDVNSVKYPRKYVTRKNCLPGTYYFYIDSGGFGSFGSGDRGYCPYGRVYFFKWQ